MEPGTGLPFLGLRRQQRHLAPLGRVGPEGGQVAIQVSLAGEGDLGPVLAEDHRLIPGHRMRAAR